VLRRLIVAVEACPSWNEKFILSHSLPMFNHRPGHTQRQKVQSRHEYPSRISVSDALGCRYEMCLNDNDIPAQAVALPRTSERMSHILTLELNSCIDSCVDSGMELAIQQ